MKTLGRIVAVNWSIGIGLASRRPKNAFFSPSSRLLRICGPASQRTDRGLLFTSSSSQAPAVDRDGKLQSDESSPLEGANHTPFRKKKVALWVGYVGTAFKGLQILRGSEAVNTIEYELQRAIFEAGGILESNYGSLDKVNWSRSSRTDKGVHSLSTVISMKMEIPSSAWVRDPSGLLLADSINMHLPPTIQVFGIVPVTKSFDARRFCCSRTYEYLLPALMLGLSGNSSPETIAMVLEKFRSILSMFQGRFAFHNYTIRRFYRADAKSKQPTKQHRNRREESSSLKEVRVKSEAPAEVAPVEDEGSPIEVLHIKDEESPVEMAPIEDGDSPIEMVDEDKELRDGSEEVPVVIDKKRRMDDPDRIMAYWLGSPDLGDKLSAAHFRRILECCCGGLENFNGVQFVRISITGESFMVHQIRKIVATAVAILNQLLPSDIIPISLCRHSRVTLPLAPPEGLVLAKNSFYPYRQLLTPAFEREFRESDVGLLRLKELPKLEISKQMSEKVDLFWRDVLLPELAPRLEGSLPLWSTWQEKLVMGSISEAEIEPVRARYIKWREESRLKMAEAKSAE